MNKSIHKRRMQRIRRKLKKVNKDRPRLSVHKSSKNISAQIIDDKIHKTLVSASSTEKKANENVTKKDLTAHIAKLLAKRALEKKISKVYFDRGKHKYHGVVKKFADTLRESGVIF